MKLLETVKDTSGNITVSRDDFYSMAMGQPDKPGYCASVKIKNGVYTGRGLSVEEATERLTTKIKNKFGTEPVNE